MHPKPSWPALPGSALQTVSQGAFQPRANRQAGPTVPFVMTTERCHLSCVMCHFNGPGAVKKSGTIDPKLVRKALEAHPKDQRVWFVSTGEFFSDPNALEHLRGARDLGLSTGVISHGQLLDEPLIDQVLEAGVREFLFSVDSTNPEQYAKIRRGGRLEVVLAACGILRKKKAQYPSLRVGISVISFSRPLQERHEVEAFWRERVDYLQFVAEYHEIFHFRKVFSVPEQRVNCDVRLIPLPTGRVAPCCAVAIYAHDQDVSWLPHLDHDTPEEAYQKLCDLYDDSQSPLAKLCQKCDWWAQFALDAAGNSPIYDQVRFDAPTAAESAELIRRQQHQLEEKEAVIQFLAKACQERLEALEQKEAVLQAKDADLLALLRTSAERQEKIQVLRDKIAQLRAKNDELRGKVERLRAER